MRKFFYLTMAICLPMMFVCSCGNDDEVEPTTQSQTGNADNPGSQEEDIVPHNEIWYTSTDGNVVTPSISDGFGANIVSNTYTSGKGIIKFDGDVTSIGEDAFLACTSLASITIPNSVTSIGDCTFSTCFNLATINIPNSVTSIGNKAFLYCSNLASVILPNSVTSIGDDTFYECSSLGSITIPNSVKSIDICAFSGCSSLTSVTIPNSVTRIEVEAFSGCPNIASIIVDSGNTKFDSRNNCNAIIETSTNTLIAGCKNTIIPNSVTSIGINAFSGCSSLASIIIPNSVTSIGVFAFFSCSNLASVTIPNSVTSIGICAFNGCSSLPSITIPKSVTSIGHQAFFACSSLTSVYVCWNNPLNIDNNVFLNSGIDNAILYVPVGTKTKYESADVWKDFGSIVEWDAQ